MPKKSKVERIKKMSYELTNDRCACSSEGSMVGKGGKVIKKDPSFTCYSMASLQKMALAINQEYAGKRTPISIKGKTKRQLWDAIQKSMSGTCDTEECWKEQDFIKRMKDLEIEHHTFKKRVPEKWIRNNVWLSNFDIDYVMRQYEKIYPNYIYLGTQPSNCPVDYHCEISNFDPIKARKSGIESAGIVFNLDKLGQSGSHWVGCYIDLKNNEIDYYDSYGDQPNKPIKLFLVRLSERFILNKEQVKIVYNDKRHQFGNSECGVYSMNFILERLNGTPMKKITKSKILDRDMNYLRRMLFHVDEKAKVE